MDDNKLPSKSDVVLWVVFAVAAVGLMSAWAWTMQQHPEYLNHLPRGRW